MLARMYGMSDGVWLPWVLALAVVVLLYSGRSAIRELIDDAARGIRAFRDRL